MLASNSSATSRFARYFLLTAALALAALSPASAGADDEIAFRFAPHTGKAYQIETTRTQTTTFRDNNAKDIFEFHTHERYEKAEEGFRLHQKIVNNRMTRNGSEIQSPMNMLLSEVDVLFHIDAEGEVTKVDGFDKIPELFKERFPAPVFGAFAPMINIRSLENQQVDRWKERHRPFIGKNSKLGGHIIQADLVTLPRGGSLLVYSVYQLETRTQYQGREALKVKLSFSSDASSLAEELGIESEALEASAGELSATGEGTISGSGTILVDDASLEVFSVDTTKRTQTTVAVPGQDMPEPYMSAESFQLRRTPPAVPASADKP